MPGPSFQPVTIETVYAEFGKLLRDRNSMGLHNLLGDTLLEPCNPFQKSRRRAKRGVGGLVAMFLIAFLILWYFHLR